MTEDRDQSRKRQATDEYKETRRKSKYAKCDDSTGKDYGPNAQVQDISADSLRILCDDVMKHQYGPISKQTQRHIETETLGQAENPAWMKHRRQRITASLFGDVVRRMEKTPCAKLVKCILYSNGNISHKKEIRWGRENEHVARQDYMKKTGNFVRQCGLFVHVNDPWLAASPDGIVLAKDGTQGLLEIKCLYKAYTYDLTPEEASVHPECKKSMCSVFVGGQAKLKETHNYYYQIQGQLEIAEYDWCDFVLWTPKGISIQRIKRDKSLWQNRMLPKLRNFFIRCVLPEIASPRHPRKMAIREPSRP